jgi:hypothetical protein
VATSNIKSGSYTQPDQITLTLTRRDLANLADGAPITWKGFKLRAGIRLNVIVQAEGKTN